MTAARSFVETQAAGSAVGIAARFAGVSRMLGATAFTLMPLPRSSSAIDSVSLATADLAAQYAPMPGFPDNAAAAATLTIRPRLAAIMPGTVARQVLTSVATLSS